VIILEDLKHKTKAEVRQAYRDNEDFFNRTVTVGGTYARRTNIEQYFPHEAVKIWFNATTEFTVLPPYVELPKPKKGLG